MAKRKAVLSAISPIISTDLLADIVDDPGIKVIDIREKKEYEKGHIPSAVNVPFNLWSTERNGLLLELLNKEELFSLIGKTGIKKDSKLVIVNNTDNAHALTDAARVAVTLIYAGINNVSILNGGYSNWIKENRPVSKRSVKQVPVKYRGTINKNIFVNKKYVLNSIGKSILIDARAPECYFGLTDKPFGMKISFNDRLGHIPTAKCLPTPWIWDEDGTYRNFMDLGGIVASIAGKNKLKEIIIYCGVGGNSAGWWYLLTRIMGYKNVKYYNGSMQEWSKDPETPLVINRWE